MNGHGGILFLRRFASTLGCLVLASCIGGSDSDYLFGRVADGYIQNATVWWDCNNDWLIGEDEVRTTSGEGGAYFIRSQPAASCVLRALAQSTSIDEDTGQSFPLPTVFSAIPGKPLFISSLTTLVASGVGSEDYVRQQLGLPLPLDVDFIAAGDSGIPQHNAARAVGAQQKAVGSRASMDEGIRKGIGQSILTRTAAFQSSYLTSVRISNAAVDAFVNREANDLFSWYFRSYMSDAEKLVVNPYRTFSEGQRTLLENMISTAVRAGAVSGKSVRWLLLDDAELTNLNARAGEQFPDSPAVEALIRSRREELAEIGSQIRAIIQGSNKLADAEFIRKVVASSIKYLYGVAQVGASVPSPNFIRRALNARKNGTLKSTLKLDRLLVLKKLTSCSGAVNSMIDVLNATHDGDLTLEEGTNLISAITDVTSCILALANSEEFDKVISSADYGNGVAKSFGLLEVVGGLEALKSALELGVGETPWGVRALGAMDAVIGIGEILVAEAEYNERAALRILTSAEDTARLFDPVIQRTYRRYQSLVLRARLGDALMSYEDLATAFGIAPASITAGAARTLSILGSNLPTGDGLIISGSNCVSIQITQRTDTAYTIRCDVPSVGEVRVSVTAAGDGTSLGEFRTIAASATCGNGQIVSGSNCVASTATHITVMAVDYPGISFTNPSTIAASCTVSATGSWTNGGGTAYKGPDGYVGSACGSTCRSATAPSHSLIVARQVNGTEVATLVGAAQTLNLSGSETVRFSTNDSIQPYAGRPNAYFDNAGSMSLSILCSN